MRRMPRSGITIARGAQSWRRDAACVGSRSRAGVSLRSTTGYSSYAAPRRFVGQFALHRPFIDAQKRGIHPSSVPVASLPLNAHLCSRAQGGGISAADGLDHFGDEFIDLLGRAADELPRFESRGEVNFAEGRVGGNPPQ
jgi:hypothetical protein